MSEFSILQGAPVILAMSGYYFCIYLCWLFSRHKLGARPLNLINDISYAWSKLRLSISAERMWFFLFLIVSTVSAYTGVHLSVDSVLTPVLSSVVFYILSYRILWATIRESVREHDTRLFDRFPPYTRVWFPMMLIGFFVPTIIGIGSLAFIVPGIMLIVCLVFSHAVCCIDSAGALRSIVCSINTASGRFMEVSNRLLPALLLLYFPTLVAYMFWSCFTTHSVSGIEVYSQASYAPSLIAGFLMSLAEWLFAPIAVRELLLLRHQDRERNLQMILSLAQAREGRVLSLQDVSRDCGLSESDAKEALDRLVDDRKCMLKTDIDGAQVYGFAHTGTEYISSDVESILDDKTSG